MFYILLYIPLVGTQLQHVFIDMFMTSDQPHDHTGARRRAGRERGVEEDVVRGAQLCTAVYTV